MATATTAGGTRIKDITFQGGSLTDPTTGVDSVTGGVMLSAAFAMFGCADAIISPA